MIKCLNLTVFFRPQHMNKSSEIKQEYMIIHLHLNVLFWYYSLSRKLKKYFEIFFLNIMELIKSKLYKSNICRPQNLP
jgi:hypothetical protein